MSTNYRCKVSVGIPVYNGENYLAEAIKSYINQTFDDFEIIISDNGSTDATEEICRKYSSQDKRIHYYRSNENRGAAWNHNRVVELSSGEYFKWAAHDDICAPTLLERSVEVFDKSSSSVVLCFSLARIIDKDGSLLWEYWPYLDMHETRPYIRLRHLVLNIGFCVAPLYGLIRASALRKSRGLGGFLSADHVLLAELALLGEFREVPEYLFSYRLHEGTSQKAHASVNDLAEWILPGSGEGIVLEYWTVFAQHLQAINYLPLNILEKLKSYVTFIPIWGWAWRKILAQELLSLPGQMIKRKS